ncbi:MAG: hypothetical protein WKF40_02495 [Thermoleophilaceae bacterium]
MSTLATVLIVVGVLVVLLFVGGVLGARRRDQRRSPPDFQPTRSSRRTGHWRSARAERPRMGPRQCSSRPSRKRWRAPTPDASLRIGAPGPGRGPAGGSQTIGLTTRLTAASDGVRVVLSRDDSGWHGETAGLSSLAPSRSPGFEPENDARSRASGPTQPLRAGWAWGKPRSGHPEGTVGAHV